MRDNGLFLVGIGLLTIMGAKAVKQRFGSRSIHDDPTDLDDLLDRWVDQLAENQYETDKNSDGWPYKTHAKYRKTAAKDLAEDVETNGVDAVLASGLLPEDLPEHHATRDQVVASLRRAARR